MAVSPISALSVLDQECGRYGGAWYVAETEWNAERLAACSIREIGFQTFLPFVRIQLPQSARRPARRELRPAFLGYIFVLWHAGETWQRIKSARGVAGILHLAGDRERPAPVRQRFMDALLARASIEGVIEDQSVPELLPAINVGAPVVVTSGLLADRGGICVWSNEERVRLMLHATGHAVTLRRDFVQVEG